MPLNAHDIATLSRLLDEALELDASQHAAWLAALPPEHQRHGKALRDMLAAQSAGHIGDRWSAMPRIAPDDAQAHAGDRIGPYSLIAEIGRGGMGSVWLAARDDGSFKRQVALKLPHAAWGARLAERMGRERDIGALLEHPNIARLYDAGVDERGRPFIAMAFIDGQPIDAWCGQHAPDVRARLRLFVQVVRAVAYAHGRLVIHLDLKPANVLVDARGQAHLLDFGIAKLIDATAIDTGLTQEQGRAMTPLYASPEQIEGQPVGVAADVYSLGVMLYELLTGTMPVTPKRASLGAIEEAILQGDAPPASSRAKDRTVAKALRGDLDAILARAMKRQPVERYASADALAEDIERHLAGDTVKARPDSTGYRLRKAIVRHRVGFAATAAVLAAVLVGGGAALVQAQRAAQQMERARLATAFVSEMFRVGSRSGTSATAPNSGMAPMLDQGALLIEARFPGQPDMQAELYGVVGRIYADLGAGEMAVDYAKRQIKLLDPLAVDHERRVLALLQLAEACYDEGLLSDARAHAERTIATATPGSESLAAALIVLARVDISVGERKAGAAAARRAQVVLSALGGRPTVAAARLLMVQGALQWGGVPGELPADVDRALPMYLRAIDVALQVEGATSHTAAEVRRRLAFALIAANRGAESRPHMDAALAGLRRSGGAGEIQAAVMSSVYWPFLFAWGGASAEESLSEVEKDRAFLAAQTAPIPAVVRARVDYGLAKLYVTRGELSEARRLIAPSATTLKAASPQHWGDRYEVIAYEGNLATLLGEHAVADALLREALALRQQGGGGDDPAAALDWAWLTLNRLMQGDLDQAESVLRGAPHFGVLPGKHADAAEYSRLLPAISARVMLARGDIRGALATMPPVPADHVDIDPVHAEHAVAGEILCAAGRPREGLPELVEAIRSVSPRVSDNHPALARIRAVAGLCALSLGDKAQAATLAGQAHRAFAAQPEVSPYFKAPLDALDQALGTARRATT